MIHFDIPDLHKVVDEMVNETYRTFGHAEREVKDFATTLADTLIKESPQWTGNYASNWQVRGFGEAGGSYDEPVALKAAFGFKVVDGKLVPGTNLVGQTKSGGKKTGYPRKKGDISGIVEGALEDIKLGIKSTKFNPDSKSGVQGVVIFNNTPYGKQVEQDNLEEPWVGRKGKIKEGKYIRRVNYYNSTGPITLGLALQKTVALSGGKWRV